MNSTQRHSQSATILPTTIGLIAILICGVAEDTILFPENAA
jgi:hypothetical protein